MAIYELGRLQVRRGRALTDIGIPQLASGELAWAIDSQELYIGNGAVSEGSPFVGNTKILTEHDLTTDYIDYQYKKYDTTITATTRRLVNRLSDRVTAHDFGAIGDGIANDTLAIQDAINQLFFNSSGIASTEVTDRVKLELLPGIYNITQTLMIPAYASIIGSGLEKTIINYSSFDITCSQTILESVIYSSAASMAFINNYVSGTGIQPNSYIVSVVEGTSMTLSLPVTSSSTSNIITLTPNGPALMTVDDYYLSGSGPGEPYDTQARFITLKDFTLQTNIYNTAFYLNAVRDSLFENIIIKCLDDFTASTGIEIPFNTTRSENNIFRNINIDNFDYGIYVYCFNTLFENSVLSRLQQGITLDGGDFKDIIGPNFNTFNNIKLLGVKEIGVWIKTGTDNHIQNCVMVDVGNNSTSGVDNYDNIAYPQIYLTNTGNNINNITSSRLNDLTILDNIPEPLTNNFLSIISGLNVFYNVPKTFTLYLSSGTDNPLFRLPIDTYIDGSIKGHTTYYIKYSLNRMYSSLIRTGVLTIIVDTYNNTTKVCDEYTSTYSEEFDLLITFEATLNLSPTYVLVTYTDLTDDGYNTFDFTYDAHVICPMTLT